MTTPGPARRLDTAGVALVLALSIALAWCLGLGTDGAWYSQSWGHRLQTEALLRGTFALQSVPNGQMADWAWGHGSQQVWGLGVAFVRLPFELLARWCGLDAFPDRVTLLVAFAAVASVLASALRDLPAPQRACLVALTAFNPAFVTLCRTRLSVYEESSAYACLYGLLLAGLLLRMARGAGRHALPVLGALAGVAPFFRPTLMFTGAVTMLAALALARREHQPLSRMVAGVALFAAGLATVGLVNFLRFGSAFETGQLLNVSYIPLDQFSKVFGYPFWDEPWTSALRELVSSLCLAEQWNGVDWYQAAIHPWQSPTLRFREFYFSTFTPAILGMTAMGWLAAAAAAGGSAPGGSADAPADPRIAVAGAWSLSVFLLLFAFYLWAPSMTSRYAVDFVPAVAMSLVALWMWLFRAAGQLAGPMWPALVALAGILVDVHGIARAAISPTHADRRLATAAVVRERMPRPVTEGTRLPDAYRCGANPEQHGVKFNGSGWASTGDCTVTAGTMLFFAGVDCLAVDVEPPAGPGPLSPAQLAPIRVKAGLVELARVAEMPTPSGATLRFCRQPALGADDAEGTDGANDVEVVYMGWMDPRNVRRDSRPLRLVTAAKVAR